MKGRQQRGFTLIEVMVAMAVFGVVALTLLNQSREQVRAARSLEDRLLAHWVALNVITDYQSSPAFIELGRSQLVQTLAGRDWSVSIDTSTTPLPNVRRIEVAVSPGGSQGAPVINETAFVMQQQPAPATTAAPGNTP